jgi:hypothetical protein
MLFGTHPDLGFRRARAHPKKGEFVRSDNSITGSPRWWCVIARAGVCVDVCGWCG